MKRCPTCNRVEADNNLVFCRVDGAALNYYKRPTGYGSNDCVASNEFTAKIQKTINNIRTRTPIRFNCGERLCGVCSFLHVQQRLSADPVNRRIAFRQ